MSRTNDDEAVEMPKASVDEPVTTTQVGVTVTKTAEAPSSSPIFFPLACIGMALFAILTIVFGCLYATGSGPSGPGAPAPSTVVASPPAPPGTAMEAAAAAIAAIFATGQFDPCPAESFFWAHHPDVFGGYSGCVSENGFIPGAQNGFEGVSAMVSAHKKYVWNATTEKVITTDNTIENETMWILWGHPQDKYELQMRTGLNPVVVFPLNRGPYPSYSWRGGHGDDAADLIEIQKDFLVYEGAFTETELDDFSGVGTEGAEQGMDIMWAAMALSIAKTTCNRAIYALMEAPAYGYSTSTMAKWVNHRSSQFYAGEECACYATSTCNDPTVTISNRGWLPGSDYPVETGADGVAYSADSTSATSPWFESMVFPENPSGRIKVGRLPANRRVCDGVYLYPMYFGGKGYEIPIDEKPDCSCWAFSITKVYSASVRAGTILYKTAETDLAAAITTISSDNSAMPHGLFSEWTWFGQQQVLQMLMERPVTSPTSFIGAYSTIIEEKWNHVIEGFAGCPFIEITNPHEGAYVFFKHTGDNIGKEDGGTVSTFFMEVLNIKATTYYWGFRGATPSVYYGADYGTRDFVRMQLYRDISAYAEVSRRAKIVCAGGSLPGYLTAAEWQASKTATTRRQLNGAPRSHSDVARHLSSVAPHLSEAHAHHLAKIELESETTDRAVEQNCAPEYTTDCLMEHIDGKAETRAIVSKQKEEGARRLAASGVVPKPVYSSSYHEKRAHADQRRKLAESPMMLEAKAKIAETYKFASYEICPPESFYYEHHPKVFGGYKGCVSENGLIPGGQDGFEGVGAMTSFHKKYVWNATSMEVITTDNTIKNATMWILWGHPQDKYELNKRVGTDPAVVLPLNRGPYPSYSWRGGHGDDAGDLIPVQKDFLVYEGAFTAAELEEFSGVGTEGAEQGMDIMWAAMALSIAKTTCNRAIYALMEAPAYGYSTSTMAKWVNDKASSFYAGEECPCYNASTCNDPTVTISNRGWLPATEVGSGGEAGSGPSLAGAAMPMEMGGDGVMYPADSTSPNSPWFESMVFPENPSGRIKVGRLPANRRVCDGVYLYPMYFGGEGYSIPLAKKPDCVTWAFSITKVWSASVRAGTILYKTADTEMASAVVSITSAESAMPQGLYSEWSVVGQIQILEYMMTRPLASEKSWLTAYSKLIEEKWNHVIAGFAECPFIEITNPHAGAYVFFKHIGDNVGKEDGGSVSSFFMDVLNIKATTYFWGFRGAVPATYYGFGYGTKDFVRMQLYRDIHVYAEVARRATIVCAGGSLPGYLSAAEWQASKTSSRRQLGATRSHKARHLSSVAPHLTSAQADNLAQLQLKREAEDAAVEAECAAEGYTTDCMMKHI